MRREQRKTRSLQELCELYNTISPPPPSFLPSFLLLLPHTLAPRSGEELHLWTEEPCIPFTPSCIKVCKRVRDTGPPSRFHLHNSLRRRSAIGRASPIRFLSGQETRGSTNQEWRKFNDPTWEMEYTLSPSSTPFSFSVVCTTVPRG